MVGCILHYQMNMRLWGQGVKGYYLKDVFECQVDKDGVKTVNLNSMISRFTWQTGLWTYLLELS